MKLSLLMLSRISVAIEKFTDWQSCLKRSFYIKRKFGYFKRFLKAFLLTWKWLWINNQQTLIIASQKKDSPVHILFKSFIKRNRLNSFKISCLQQCKFFLFEKLSLKLTLEQVLSIIQPFSQVKELVWL